MKTNRIIFIIGLLVSAVPIAGFPRSWEEAFLVLAGLILMLLSSLNIWQRSILKRLKYHSKKTEVQNNLYEEAIKEQTSTES